MNGLDGNGGCGAIVGLGGFVVLLLVGLLVIMPMLADFNNSEAARIRAQAERVDAQRRYEHQQSVDWQHEFQLWTVAIAAFTGGLTGKDLLLGLSVCGCARLGGMMLGGRVQR